MKRQWGGVILFAATVLCGPSHGESREHGAHVHGTAELDVAKVGNELAIDFRSPAMNIVGFEHAPTTDAQRRALADVLEQLRSPEALFGVPAAAGCEVTLSRAERAGGHARDNEHGEHGEHDEHDGHDGRARADGEHSEIRARYRFECSAPEVLDAIGLRLFERFPATEFVRLQLLTDDAQRSAVLTPEQSRIVFE